MKKQIGFIGLGKMGQNMVLNLLSKKYKVVVYNRSPEPVRKLARKGAIPSYSLEEFVKKLPKPRVILMMITAGKPVDEIINKLFPLLSNGDILIDGGNSHYKNSIKRYKKLKEKRISFVDLGTSGGLIGARHGASLTIGGNKNTFKKIEPLFRDLSVKNGYGYFGTSGAGHFLKTIHNGIEYSLLESYAEGFETLNKSKYKFDYEKVAGVWNNGSVIRSWITELAEKVFKKSNYLGEFKGKIGGGETGKWAFKIAKKEGVDASTLKHALKKRKKSLKKQAFSTKFISAIRKEFGGHREP